VKERPILFSAPMVRALLTGTKTVTRRLVNPQPEHLQVHTWKGKTLYDAEHRIWWWKTHSFENLIDFDDGRRELAALNPYGNTGDRLWVRESFRTSRDEPVEPGATILYPADLNDYDRKDKGPWRPSIFMPRWASRILLEIVSVRVEPLLDITDEDAQREGVEKFFTRFTHIGRDQRLTTRELASEAEYRASFACLWDEINGDRALWNTNPWVWRVEFKRVEAAS